MSTNSCYIVIDKLMIWRSAWTKYDCKISNMFLRIHYDQLFITADTKILESFNMHHNLKGIYKDDVMILIVHNINNEMRKLKFQIKSNIAQCLELLGRHFPVVKLNAMQSNASLNAKYRNIDEVLKNALKKKENTIGVSNLSIQFEHFMKLCLLDPSFPQFVLETEKTLTNVILKK